MDKRRVLVPLGLVLGLVLVGAGLEVTGRMNGRSPLGAAVGADASSGGCNGDVAVAPPTDVSNIHVIEAEPARPKRARPSDKEANALVPGLFVVKLAEPVTGGLTVARGQLITGVSRLDNVLDSVAVRNATPLNAKVPTRVGARHLGLGRTFVFESSGDPDDVVDRLEADPDVEWAMAAVPVESTATPNDTFFSFQWNMATLRIPQAHDTTQGEGVIVAVIDTGVSAFDDGYMTLLPGTDIYDRDSDPSDEGGHGTHVAGTIAQSTNNAFGVMGVAPQASILPVRVLGPDGGTDLDVAEGIIWAVDHGAQVINMSLGGPSFSAVMSDAVDYARNNNVVVVAATGNDSFTDFIGYPAAYPSVIAVGATDLEGEIAPYSNQGPGIDISAPGGDVTVDLDNDGFGDGILQETFDDAGDTSFYFFQGTSMATPHVAGTAALLIAAGITRVDDVEDALLTTADDRGAPGHDTVFGHGIVNPVAALQFAPQPPPPELTITRPRARIRPKKPRRAVVRWGTSVPATSQIVGSDGRSKQDDEPVLTHKFTIRGTPGDTVTYTITSRDAENQVATATATVTFPQ